MSKTVISELTIRDSARRGEHRLTIPVDAIVTDLAAELARARGITLVREDVRAAQPAPVPPPAGALTVAIGSDHGGFALKKSLIDFLSGLGIRTVDVGTGSEEPCDYPDFAYQVAQSVAGQKADLGIMIDGAGIGSCMAVNKVPGIRGACCAHEFTARNAREHNNANVLTLGSRVVGLEVAKAIVQEFVQTSFAGGRHAARVDKIMRLEKKYLHP
jgi:ribose 5-phosphate isomerase B